MLTTDKFWHVRGSRLFFLLALAVLVMFVVLETQADINSSKSVIENELEG